MSDTVHGPFTTVREALAKIDELTSAKKKAFLSSRMVKGTDKYHKRLGFLKSGTFEWFVKEGNKSNASDNT